MTKYIARNGGIAITDLNAIKDFYLSAIPKRAQRMPGVHSLEYAAKRAEDRLIASGFPASEFEGATLFYRNASIASTDHPASARPTSSSAVTLMVGS